MQQRHLPEVKAMLGDWGYDADWFRTPLTARGITACVPSKIDRKIPVPHDRIHTRYGRCAYTFMSAICIAATVIFWL